MRGHHCEKDVGTKVAAFTNYLGSSNPNQETPNLTTENVELLTKFATFLQEQKHEKRMHMHGHEDGHWHGKHGHKHGKFGKHGHHGMFGHHFGRHGPYGKMGHGHHGHDGHGIHGKHGFEFGKHFEHEKHFGKHHKHGKHFWKHVAMVNMDNPDQTIVIEDNGCEANDSNTSPPPQENTTVANVVEQSSAVNKAQCVHERKGHCCGRRRHAQEWVIVPRPAEAQQGLSQTTPQTERNKPPQDNLATMVENINIENSPEKE